MRMSILRGKHSTKHSDCCKTDFIFEVLDVLDVGCMRKSEAVAQRCSVKKVFLEISQNSQENTCARVSFLIKLQA